MDLETDEDPAGLDRVDGDRMGLGFLRQLVRRTQPTEQTLAIERSGGGRAMVDDDKVLSEQSAEPFEIAGGIRATELADQSDELGVDGAFVSKVALVELCDRLVQILGVERDAGNVSIFLVDLGQGERLSR